MKKLIVGLLTAALMTLGLGFVGSVTSPATSVNCKTYPGCIKAKVKTRKTNKIQNGKKQTLRVLVKTPGNLVPTGKVTISIKRIGGGYTLKPITKAYTGKLLVFQTGALTIPGRYQIYSKFVGDAPFGDLKDNRRKFVVRPKA